MKPAESEVQSVRACTEDPQALAELYRAHGAAVRSFLLRVQPRAAIHEIEDLAQEVFLAVPRAAKHFRGDASVRAWLLGIARKTARSRARRAAIRNALWRRSSPVDPRPTPDLRHHDLSLDVERAMLRLSVDHREVLVLVVIDGLSAKEVGRIIRVKEKTVWTRLHRARAALAALLSESQPSRGGRHAPKKA